MHMGSTAGQLRQILERELAIHRELLRLARSRHLLLKQGRFDEAADLAVLEAAYIVTLRDLESRRRQLRHKTSTKVPDVATFTWQIATLVRGLGAVERANRTLWSERVLVPALAAMAGAGPGSGRFRRPGWKRWRQRAEGLPRPGNEGIRRRHGTPNAGAGCRRTSGGTLRRRPHGEGRRGFL